MILCESMFLVVGTVLDKKPSPFRGSAATNATDTLPAIFMVFRASHAEQTRALEVGSREVCAHSRQLCRKNHMTSMTSCEGVCTENRCGFAFMPKPPFQERRNTRFYMKHFRQDFWFEAKRIETQIINRSARVAQRSGLKHMRPELHHR